MKRRRRAYVGSYRKPNQISGYEKRIKTLIGLTLIIFAFIIGRLFQLQVLKHAEYSQAAQDQHFGSIELPAKRGEIFVRDRNSGELSKLATNTTLNLLYVDPNFSYVDENGNTVESLTPTDLNEISEKLAPLIFTEEDYQACLEDPRECNYAIEDENSISFSASELEFSLNPELEEVELDAEEESEERNEAEPQNEGVDEQIPEESAPVFKPYSAMVQEVAAETLKKISKKEVDFVVLKRGANEELMEAIRSKNLPGITVEESGLIHGDPTLIPEKQIESIAKALSPLLEEERDDLERQLSRRPVRYVFLKNRLSPETSEEIRTLKLKGVVLLPENWRYYPEDDLAAHVIGFINHENLGQYGVEAYFNNELQGKSGTISSETDPNGRQINVGEGEIINAEHGEDIILTLNHIVQKEVEDILSAAVESYQADSGQVIIMNPSTGAIIAMASYPDFNPNEFSDALTLRQLEPDDYLYHTTPVFVKDEEGGYTEATEEEREDEAIERFVYENRLGPGAFRNPIVSDLYEPGSVFKPIIMSIALDAGEVTPQTTYNDYGELEIDGFPIRNSDLQYRGPNTPMTQVLEESLNTGMVFVADRLGNKLMQDYLEKFGFGQYTNINLDGETQGDLEHHTDWTAAERANRGFGQGIVATPLQVVTAWAALANGGKLVQPYLIESVIKDDEVIETEPQVIHRVLSNETSSLITSMLINVVQKGHGTKADIPGYSIAGKTGTSQIASTKRAGYEEGVGSVITSFAGYFPANNPQFVMLVKFDRPRLGFDAWGSNTAAPTFGQIAEFLIEHYQIQPS